MARDRTNVFVSYSHADAALVAPVVKLLRTNQSLVFQDIDSIVPGKRWRDQLAAGLAESQLVVLFWCSHASRSDEVAREWQAALAQDKDLLPLLLDATPLPAPLGEFQWIDFRDTVGAHHALHPGLEPTPGTGSAAGPATVGGPVGSPAQAPAPLPRPQATPERPAARRSTPRWFAIAAAAAVFAFAGILSVTVEKHSSVPDPMTTTPKPSDVPPTRPPVDLKKPPPPAKASPVLTIGVPIALAALLSVLGFAWWRRLRRGAIPPAASPAAQQPEAGMFTTVERDIASKLEAEILRRTAQFDEPVRKERR